ncbi:MULTISPECIES: helix-turn-helix domain-containing protein [Paenibacillus]|uniref:helix-turn-helix domain-containing protein n=1 Tax=Paenibacillus TaxID=44249 RepID=UPI00135C313B|nr:MULTISPECIES: helix-turn-helix transcriptional regulator [Paenibacillus]
MHYFYHWQGNDHKSKFLLTHREREVFELLVQDKTTRDIAGQLFISEKTVRNHILNVMQKLNVKDRSQAVVELIEPSNALAFCTVSSLL